MITVGAFLFCHCPVLFFLQFFYLVKAFQKSIYLLFYIRRNISGKMTKQTIFFEILALNNCKVNKKRFCYYIVFIGFFIFIEMGCQSLKSFCNFVLHVFMNVNC